MLKKLTPNLMVEDVAQTLTFYEDVLGFTTLTTVPDEPPFVFAIVQRDGVEMMFQSRPSLSENVPALAGMPIGASQSFYVEVENVEELYRQIEGKAEIAVDMHTTWYGTREFYFRDINGYIFGFSQALPQDEAG
jgi:lactoylglutathione lyase